MISILNPQKLLTVGMGILVTTVVTVAYGNLTSNAKRTTEDMAKASVMITNKAENSGGTGVIIRSNSKVSQILTNRHVCKLLKNGGTVITDSGVKYPVFSYRESNLHDMCLVSVASDLRVNTMVAERAPREYEDASVAGHPSLYPSIITKGHFSKRSKAYIQTGLKECTQEDMQNGNILLCIFLGGIPIITEYDVQVLSPTIEPGSSGSAVYNSDGELSALVFAGNRGLSYALAVPYEYVKKFLLEEVNTLEEKLPDNSITLNLN